MFGHDVERNAEHARRAGHRVLAVEAAVVVDDEHASARGRHLQHRPLGVVRLGSLGDRVALVDRDVQRQRALAVGSDVEGELRAAVRRDVGDRAFGHDRPIGCVAVHGDGGGLDSGVAVVEQRCAQVVGAARGDGAGHDEARREVGGTVGEMQHVECDDAVAGVERGVAALDSAGRTLVNAHPVGASVQFDHVSPAPLVSNTSSGSREGDRAVVGTARGEVAGACGPLTGARDRGRPRTPRRRRTRRRASPPTESPSCSNSNVQSPMPATETRIW